MIARFEGCMLCLDWTGTHKAKECSEKSKSGKPYEACSQKVGTGTCGKPHNRLLHGTNNKYCNSARRIANHNQGGPHLLGQGEPGAPSSSDIGGVDAAHALFQLQVIPFQNEFVDRASTFFDSGSNVNLVTEDFARRARLNG